MDGNEGGLKCGGDDGVHGHGRPKIVYRVLYDQKQSRWCSDDAKVCMTPASTRLVSREEGHDDEGQVGEVRDGAAQHALVGVAAAVAVDVEDAADGPGTEEAGGGDGVRETIA